MWGFMVSMLPELSKYHKQGDIFFFSLKFLAHRSRHLCKGSKVSLVVIRAVVNTKDITYLLNESINRFPREWVDGSVGNIFAAQVGRHDLAFLAAIAKLGTM